MMQRTESETERSNKVRLILKAAQKRFGLFGVEKTSMKEIASDLNLSKASLYYYFPDKENLYKAVVQKEQDEFLAQVSGRIVDIDDPVILLSEYATSRLSYFRALLNLSRLRYEEYSGLKPVLRETIIQFNKREKDIIISIIKKGIDRGVFREGNASEIASLFLDLLKGLRISVVSDKMTMFIEQEEFDALLEKTTSFTRIFVNGLKSNN